MTASAGRNLQLVAKSAKDSVNNRSVVRATVVGVKDSNEQLVEKFVDEFDLEGQNRGSSLLSNELLKPPFDPVVMAQLPENNSEMGKCIEAMEVNIEGFGGRLQSVIPAEILKTIAGNGTETDTQEQKDFNEEYTEEWHKLDSLFNNPNADDNLTTLRRKVRKDLESTGNAFWEILQLNGDINSEVTSINYVEVSAMRLGKLDTKESIVSIRQLCTDYTYKTKYFKKRFRKFAQICGQNKLIWFKEWNDNRIMDKRTGEWLKPEEASKLPKKFHATGLMWFKIHSSRSAYGIPRYVGNLFEIYGSRAASEINFITFKNNNIPSMAVLVSGGMLTDATVNRIEEFVNVNIKKSQNRSSFLILEADPGSDGLDNTGQVKIEIKPLASVQHNDELFQDYDKNNREKVRESFRLPAIYVGRGDVKDSSESRKLADEQVFAPERDEMDRRINQLVSSMGVRYWKFKSNSPTVTDDASLVNILANGERSGAVTPNLARGILGAIINRELPIYEKTDGFDPDLPMSINLMRMSSQMMGMPGGAVQTGLLAPNQGQIPKPEPTGDPENPVDNMNKRKAILKSSLIAMGFDEIVADTCCAHLKVIKPTTKTASDIVVEDWEKLLTDIDSRISEIK